MRIKWHLHLKRFESWNMHLTNTKFDEVHHITKTAMQTEVDFTHKYDVHDFNLSTVTEQIYVSTHLSLSGVQNSSTAHDANDDRTGKPFTFQSTTCKHTFLFSSLLLSIRSSWSSRRESLYIDLTTKQSINIKLLIKKNNL